MEIPHRGARPGLPEIYVHDSNPSSRYRMSSRSNSYNSPSSPVASSIPMSIPNARDPTPPPLPPPKHLPDIADGGKNGPDLAWKWGNSHEDDGNWARPMASIQPGSSLLGSFAKRPTVAEERPDYGRRTSSNSTLRSAAAGEHSFPRIDEGYASLSGTSFGSNKLVISVSPEIGVFWRRAAVNHAFFTHQNLSSLIQRTSYFYCTTH
jgi:hypothetical protein